MNKSREIAIIQTLRPPLNMKTTLTLTDKNAAGLAWAELEDRASAERTLQWVKKGIRKGRKGKFPIFEGAVEKSIRPLPD